MRMRLSKHHCQYRTALMASSRLILSISSGCGRQWAASRSALITTMQSPCSSARSKVRPVTFPMCFSALRQPAVHFLDEVLESDMPSKFATIGIMLMVDSQMRAETVEHLDDLGCFPFSQQINLQIEVISTIYDSTHSVLLDQHEGRQQYRLQRGDCR